MEFGKTMKAEVSAPFYCLIFLLILQSTALIGAQAPSPASAPEYADGDGSYVLPVHGDSPSPYDEDSPSPFPLLPGPAQTVFSPPAPPTDSGAEGPVTGNQTSSSSSKEGKHGLTAAAKGGISVAVILGIIVACVVVYVKRVREANIRRQQQSHMHPIR